MRFFSVEWLSLNDEVDVDRVISEYNEFLAGLSGKVGEKIREFRNAHCIHDSLLDRLKVDTLRNVVEFDVVAGDNRQGYSLLGFRYIGARIVTCSVEDVAEALDRRSSVVHYDEFDVVQDGNSSSKYVHRFLLWPTIRKEFGIEFHDFGFSVKPLDRRRYETYGETFIPEEY